MVVRGLTFRGNPQGGVRRARCAGTDSTGSPRRRACGGRCREAGGPCGEPAGGCGFRGPGMGWRRRSRCCSLRWRSRSQSSWRYSRVGQRGCARRAGVLLLFSSGDRGQPRAGAGARLPLLRPAHSAPAGWKTLARNGGLAVMPCSRSWSVWRAATERRCLGRAPAGAGVARVRGRCGRGRDRRCRRVRVLLAVALVRAGAAPARPGRGGACGRRPGRCRDGTAA